MMIATAIAAIVDGIGDGLAERDRAETSRNEKYSPRTGTGVGVDDVNVAIVAPETSSSDQKVAIIQLLSSDPRVSPGFAVLGKMYQIGDFILSGSSTFETTQGEAEAYCKKRGARLPTVSELEILAQAMGYGSSVYNPALIQGMGTRMFWASTDFPDCYFISRTGEVSVLQDRSYFKKHFRCVVPVRE